MHATSAWAAASHGKALHQADLSTRNDVITQDNQQFKKKIVFCPFDKKDVEYRLKANRKEHVEIPTFKLSFKRYVMSGQGVQRMPICEH